MFIKDKTIELVLGQRMSLFFCLFL